MPVSGVSPLHPVVSIKSGYVYERSLIEKYLKENDGKDPITGDIIQASELVDVKTGTQKPFFFVHDLIDFGLHVKILIFCHSSAIGPCSTTSGSKSVISAFSPGHSSE